MSTKRKKRFLCVEAKTTNAGPATRTHPGHPCNDDLCLNRAGMRLASLFPKLHLLLAWPYFLCWLYGIWIISALEPFRFVPCAQNATSMTVA